MIRPLLGTKFGAHWELSPSAIALGFRICQFQPSGSESTMPEPRRTGELDQAQDKVRSAMKDSTSH